MECPPIEYLAPLLNLKLSPKWGGGEEQTFSTIHQILSEIFKFNLLF